MSSAYTLDANSIGELYAAAYSLESLQERLRLFEKTTNSSTIFLHNWDRKTGTPTHSGIASSLGEADHMYQDYYAARDPRVPRILQNKRGVFHHMDVWSEKEKRSSSVYNEFLKSNLAQEGVIVTKDLPNEMIAVFGSVREANAGRMNPEEIAFSQNLFHHLLGALTLRNDFLGDRFDSLGVAELLNSRRTGVITLDRSSNVIDVSDTAYVIVGKNIGLTIKNNRLISAKASDQNRLNELINSTFSGEPKFSRRSAISIHNESGIKQISALVTPASLENRFWASKRSVATLIYITDLFQSASHTPYKLSQVLDTTVAEANFLAQFSKGHTLAKIADELGWTIGTTRWTCKKIMSKLNVSSQGQLQRLLDQLLM